MRQIILSVTVTLLFCGISLGDVVDTAQFENVNSRHTLGNPANDVLYFNAAQEYTIFTVSWEGLASSQQDLSPGPYGQYPSWGQELYARMTHESSGAYADFQLGQGQTFSANTLFSGTSFGLAGTHVLANDSFQIEFYESADDGASAIDLSPNPDAIWSDIAFTLNNEPPGSPLAFFLDDTTGSATWNRAQYNYGTHRYYPSTVATDVPYQWYELTTDTTGDYSFEIVYGDQDFDTYLFLFDSNGFDPSDTTYPGLLADDDQGGVPPLSCISSANGDLSTLTAGATYHLIVTGFNNADFGPYALVVDGPDLAEVVMGLHGIENADFNADGTVNHEDLALWKTGFGMREGAQRLDGDATGDQDVDGADFLVWQTQYEYSPDPFAAADFNEDGTVDHNDLLLWSDGYGMTEQAVRHDGNADGDGDVDGTDFLIWQQQFGAMSSPGAGLAGTAIPEPNTLTLVGAILIGMLWIRRKKSL